MSIFKTSRQILIFSKFIKQSRTFLNQTLPSHDKQSNNTFNSISHISQDNTFFHKPQCMPDLHHLEEVYNDTVYRKGKNSIFDCEDEPWCTDDKFNDRED